jgi:hypothetical protein
MLTDIVMDFIYPIYDFHRADGRRLHFLGGSPDNRLQGRCSSHSNITLVGIESVVSWADSLKASSKMGNLGSQSLFVSKLLSASPTQPSSPNIPPCHLTAIEVVWSVSCLFPGALTPLAWAKSRSSSPGPCAALSEEVSHLDIRHDWCLLVRDGVYLWPLSGVVHGNQEVSVPAFSLSPCRGLWCR